MNKKEIKSYSKEFKLIAVKMRLEQHKSYRQIAKELGLINQSYVHKWVSKYQESGESGLEDKRGMNLNDINKTRAKTKKSNIEEENLLLKAENELLKKLLEKGKWGARKA